MEASDGIRSFSVFNFPEQLVLLGAFAASPEECVCAGEDLGKAPIFPRGGALRQCACPGRITVIQKRRISQEELRAIAKKHSHPTNPPHQVPTSASSPSSRETPGMSPQHAVVIQPTAREHDLSVVADSLDHHGHLSPQENKDSSIRRTASLHRPTDEVPSRIDEEPTCPSATTTTTSPPAPSSSFSSLRIHQRCVPSWEVLSELHEELRRLSNEAMRQREQRRKEWMLRQKAGGAQGHSYGNRLTGVFSSASWGTYLNAFPERILTTRNLQDAGSDYSSEAAALERKLLGRDESLTLSASTPPGTTTGSKDVTRLRGGDTKSIGSCFSGCGVIGAIRFLLGYYLVVAAESERTASLGSIQQIKLSEKTTGIDSSSQRRYGKSSIEENTAEAELYLGGGGRKRSSMNSKDHHGGPNHGVYTLRHVNIIPLFSFGLPISPSEDSPDVPRNSSSNRSSSSVSLQPTEGIKTEDNHIRSLTSSQPNAKKETGPIVEGVPATALTTSSKEGQKSTLIDLPSFPYLPDGDCSRLLQWLDRLREQQESELQSSSSSSPHPLARRDSLSSLSSVDLSGEETSVPPPSCTVSFFPPFLGFGLRGVVNTAWGITSHQQRIWALQKQQEHLLDLEKKYQKIFLEVFCRPPTAFFYSYTADLTQPLQTHGLVAGLQRLKIPTNDDGDPTRGYTGRRDRTKQVKDQEIEERRARGAALSGDHKAEERVVTGKDNAEKGGGKGGSVSLQTKELHHSPIEMEWGHGEAYSTSGRKETLDECLDRQGEGVIRKEERKDDSLGKKEEMSAVPLELLRGKKSDAVFNLFLLEPFFIHQDSSQSNSAFSFFPVYCSTTSPSSCTAVSSSNVSPGLSPSCSCISSPDMSPWLLVLLQGRVVQRFFSVSRPRREKSRPRIAKDRRSEEETSSQKQETTVVALAAGTPLAPSDTASKSENSSSEQGLGQGEIEPSSSMKGSSDQRDPGTPKPSLDQKEGEENGEIVASQALLQDGNVKKGTQTEKRLQKGVEEREREEGVTATHSTKDRMRNERQGLSSPSSRAVFSLVVIARRLRLGAGARWYRRGLSLPALAASFAAGSLGTSDRPSLGSSLLSRMGSSFWWRNMIGLEGDVSIAANQVECEQILWRVQMDDVPHVEAPDGGRNKKEDLDASVPSGVVSSSSQKKEREEIRCDPSKNPSHASGSSSISQASTPLPSSGGQGERDRGASITGIEKNGGSRDVNGGKTNEKKEEVSVVYRPRLRFTGDLTSIVQVRGSVPIFWGHLPSASSFVPSLLQGTNPPFRLSSSLLDPQYTQSKAHFDFLHATYGCPILCLDLVRQEPPEQTEAKLSSAYRDALASVNLVYRHQQQHPQVFITPSSGMTSQSLRHPGDGRESRQYDERRNAHPAARSRVELTDGRIGDNQEEMFSAHHQVKNEGDSSGSVREYDLSSSLRHPSSPPPHESLLPPSTRNGFKTSDGRDLSFSSKNPEGKEIMIHGGDMQSASLDTGTTATSSGSSSSTHISANSLEASPSPDDLEESFSVSNLETSSQPLADHKRTRNPSSHLPHHESGTATPPRREWTVMRKLQRYTRKMLSSKHTAPGWAGCKAYGPSHGFQMPCLSAERTLCSHGGMLCLRCTYTRLGVASTHEFLPPTEKEADPAAEMALLRPQRSSAVAGETQTKMEPTQGRKENNITDKKENMFSTEQREDDGKKSVKNDLKNVDESFSSGNYSGGHGAAQPTPLPSCCCEILYEAFDWQHADQALGFDEALRRLFEVAGASLQLTGSLVCRDNSKGRRKQSRGGSRETRGQSSPISQSRSSPVSVTEEEDVSEARGADRNKGRTPDTSVISGRRDGEKRVEKSEEEDLEDRDDSDFHERRMHEGVEEQEEVKEVDKRDTIPDGWVQHLQHGILRVNCVDCLDRTNLAMLGLGVAALYVHLTALLRCKHPLKGDDRCWDFARESLEVESQVGERLPLDNWATTDLENSQAAGSKTIPSSVHTPDSSRDRGEPSSSSSHGSKEENSFNRDLERKLSRLSYASSFSSIDDTLSTSDEEETDDSHREGDSSREDGFSRSSRRSFSLSSRASSLSSLHLTSSACCWAPSSLHMTPPFSSSLYPSPSSPADPSRGCAGDGREVADRPPPFLSMLPLVLLQLVGEVWGEIGDTIALQYAGSPAMHAAAFSKADVVSTEGTAKGGTCDTKEKNSRQGLKNGRLWKAEKRNNLVVAVERYLSNRLSDAEKQRGLDLFLGYFRPYTTSTDLWSIDLYDPLTCYSNPPSLCPSRTPGTTLSSAVDHSHSSSGSGGHTSSSSTRGGPVHPAVRTLSSSSLPTASPTTPLPPLLGTGITVAGTSSAGEPSEGRRASETPGEDRRRSTHESVGGMKTTTDGDGVFQGNSSSLFLPCGGGYHAVDRLETDERSEDCAHIISIEGEDEWGGLPQGREARGRGEKGGRRGARWSLVRHSSLTSRLAACVSNVLVKVTGGADQERGEEEGSSERQRQVGGTIAPSGGGDGILQYVTHQISGLLLSPKFFALLL
ncbi:hypothetical protein CSUI_002896 [Cystoisospora suis]|uniref:SAC domain-containing protein n=1 Tax=Cystoisospora suis TaxID=483139 RepID=A0A2C6KSA7_9APIC|nr:hypothetical protein CSUI_002896 [Cystoisospora suis]